MKNSPFQSALDRAERRQAIQYEVASLLAEAVDFESIGVEVLRIIASISDWVFATIWLCGSDGQLRCVATWEAPGMAFPNFRRVTRNMKFENGIGLPGRVLKSRKPDWIDDVVTDPNFPRAPEAKLDGLHGGFAFPFKSGLEVVGVVEMFELDRATPDEDLLKLASALGTNIGNFIDRTHAESKNATKDSFIASLSHELRTPLTPTLLWVSSAAGDPSIPAEIRRHLAMVKRNLETETRLIDDLLDATRISHGKLRIEKHRCDVHEILLNTIEIIQEEITAKQLELTIETDGHARPIVLGDPVRLQQVFWNLLRNACRYTSPGGKLKVRVDTARKVKIQISDTGIGMAPSLITQMFEPFKQGHPNSGGLGLGLAISRGIIELHGGYLRGESEGPGRGSTFTICLDTTGAGPEDVSNELPLLESPHELGGIPAHILLVEDDDDTRCVLQRLLRNRGHLVEAVSGVRDAEASAGRQHFDVLISDIGLRDGTGFDVIKNVGKFGYPLLCIALSGFGTDEDVENSFKAGFDRHITKPIDIEMLQKTIDYAMTGTRPYVKAPPQLDPAPAVQPKQ